MDCSISSVMITRLMLNLRDPLMLERSTMTTTTMEFDHTTEIISTYVNPQNGTEFTDPDFTNHDQSADWNVNYDRPMCAGTSPE